MPIMTRPSGNALGRSAESLSVQLTSTPPIGSTPPFCLGPHQEAALSETLDDIRGSTPEVHAGVTVNVAPKAFKLMAHQAQAVAIARQHRRYGFFWSCGTGKTIAVYGILDDERERVSKVDGTLVLCPKSVMRAAWLADAQYFPGLRVEVCWKSSRTKRAQQIRECTADVLVTNFETFCRHIDDFRAADIQRLVVDESSRLKNHKAKITKAVIDFSADVESCYVLSGTPAPNCATEYWGQLRAIAPTLFIDRNGRPENFWQWAQTYFTPIKRCCNDRTFIERWEPKADKYPEFLERLASVSWSLSKEEAVDLPAQTDGVREVLLSPIEREAYRMAAQELLVADNAIAREARLMKLRQLTGGFAYADDAIFETGTSKLDMLAGLLEELGKESVVIWCEFRHDVDRIHQQLGESNVGVIDGRTKNAANVVEAFQRGDFQYLVCQPAAAGHGITLTRAAYAIYYAHGFSLELFEQTRDRLHRKGQTRPVTYFHLEARDTCDEDILAALQKKHSRSELIKRVLKRAAGASLRRNREPL